MIWFISLNINGLNTQAKRLSFMNWLNGQQLGQYIVCLQETHLSDDSGLKQMLRGSNMSFSASHSTNHSAGVAIIFPNSFKIEQTHCVEGRFLMLKLSSSFETFNVCSVYAPNHNNLKHPFFEDLEELVDPAVPTFLAGDFNSVFNRNLDRLNPDVQFTYRDSSVALKHLFSSFGVVDQWRAMHPNQRSYTYFRPDGSSASRIDFVGIPQAWACFCSDAKITSCPYSDHCSAAVKLKLPSRVVHGPSFWKLNTSILEEQSFVTEIQSFWKYWQKRKNDFASILIWWDLGKRHLKDLSIRFCSKLSKNRRVRREKLMERISSLKFRLDNGNLSVLPVLNEANDELAKLDLYEAKGLQVRARTRWVEEGETSSSYFLKSCKSQRLSSTIFSVNHPTMGEVSEPELVRETFSSFYKQLFTSEPVDVDLQIRLLRQLDSRLDVAERDFCEGPLTAEECFFAMKGMKSNKTPGADGLPMEFYKTFWQTLGADLVDVLNFAHRTQELSSSQARGIITLVPKKGDLKNPKNWRPISLLNVDYKIASRAIAGRLLKVIGTVVSTDQVANVPGRFIGDAVILLQSICTYAHEMGLPAALISLDQEKAFDRVDWGFLLRTLEAMGFGQSFCSWVRTFYASPQAAIQINGFLTPFFNLSRGVRQGCPLSPLLYIVCAEVLAANVRKCPRIRGLSLPGDRDCQVKICQYADDTTLCITEDQSFQALLDIYALYERASGSKLNEGKSKGLWLGDWAGRNDQPIKLQWSSSLLPCLGLVIGPDISLEDNWDKRIASLSKVFDLWQQRCLSLHGKSVVANMLALSGLWYAGSVLPTNSSIVKRINAALFKFIWSGKRELVSRRSMYLGKSDGGFSVVDVESKVMALHIQWVKRFFLTPNKWAAFFNFFINRSFGVEAREVLKFPAYYSFESLPGIFASILQSWALLGGTVVRGQAFLPDDPAGEKRDITACTTKLCYNILSTSFQETPRCVTKFDPLFGPFIWKAVWKSVNIMPLDRPVIDLCWKTTHGVLYTADRLNRFGMDVDPFCHCGSLETASHLFYECLFAQHVLAELRQVFLSFIPLCPSFCLRQILFGYNAVECEIVPPIFQYALNVAKFFIWLARNDFKFRQIEPDPNSALQLIKARLSFFLSIFSKRFVSDARKRTFHRRWVIPERHWATVLKPP